MTRSRLWRRLFRTAAALAAGGLFAACAGSGDATAPNGRPTTSRVALAASVGPVAQAAGGAATLQVAISYLHAAGDSVPLGTQTFTLADAGTQQLPITVDLAGCLTDADRRGAALGSGTNGVCVLRFDLTLLAGTTVLDRQTVSPVTARPGQITTVDQPVALYTVAKVTIVPPSGGAVGAPVRLVMGQTVALTATAVDAAGQPVTSRAPRWSSDNQAVATVDSLSGVVTPHAPGRATVTAIVGGRSAAVEVDVVPAPAAITVSVAGGLGTGTVTSQPAGITCQVTAGVASGTCSFTFPGDSSVTLTATPATGSSFASWGGDCATAGTVLSCQLTPSVPRLVTVTFVAFRTLGVTLAGNGDGTVTSQPAGINCQLTSAANGGTAGGTTTGTCTAPYLDGSSVTLTAAPTATSSFAGWTGACTTAALTCTVTLNQAQSVTATFTRRQATVTLTLGGSGAGTVTAAGAGVVGSGTCTLAAAAGSTTCTVPVQVGSAITLTAAAGTASGFGGWAGACASTTGTSCALTITADVSVGAVFTLLPVPLTVAATPGNTGAGTVTTADNAINCAIGGTTTNGTCQANTPVGSTVTLRAAPASGQVFLGWGGACAASGATPSCTLTVTAGTNVTAAFGPPQTLTLTLTGTGGSGGSGGRVTGAGEPCVLADGSGSVTCTPAVTYGTTVTLTATPDSASSFSGWSGACTGTGPCTLTLDQPRTVGATFARRRASVTLGIGGSGAGTLAVNGAAACTLAAGQNSASCVVPVDLYAAVAVTGAAANGSNFIGWTTCPGSGSGTGPCSFVAAGDRSVAGTFNLQPATLAVAPAAGNQGAGTVTFGNNTCAIGGGTSSGTCAAPFDIGATVTLTEAPAQGQIFLGWGGACAGAGTTSSCNVTVRQAATATVTFGPPQTLTLTLSGTGGGRVTGASQPCVLTAGATSVTCTPAQTYGSTITLTAAPDQGTSTFTGWGGACQASGTSPTCTLVLDQARTVTAGFQQRTAVVTLALSGSAGGSVLQSGAAVCTLSARGGSANCPITVPVGAAVSFTAQAASGAQFNGWAGPCSGTGGCSFTVAGDVTLGATFAPVYYTLNLAASTGDGGSGTLTAPAGAGGTALSCTYTASTGQTTGTCSDRYVGGTSVTVTAQPAAGSEITNWTADCAGTPTTSTACTVQMTQTRTATVFFGGPYNIGVTAAPGTNTGNGTVTGTGGVNCTLTAGAAGGACSALYNARASITYTAAPDANSYFTGWSAAFNAYCGGITALSCTFTAAGSGVARVAFATASTFELDAGNAEYSYAYGTVLVQTAGRPDASFAAQNFNAQNPRFGLGNTVTLTARPAQGAVFTGWQGDCQSFGTNPVCTLTNYRPTPGSSAPTSGIVQAIFNVVG